MASSASTRTHQKKWQSFEDKKQRKSSMTRPYSDDEYATSSSSSSSTTTCSESQENGRNKDNNDDEDDVCSKGCSTPKAKRFRIQEVLTCPPAPKKRRVIQNYSSKKSPIAFFASPDIELFFFSALGNVKT